MFNSYRGRSVTVFKALHKEADTRIVPHGVDAYMQGYKRTVVVCRDTDDLILLLLLNEEV